MLDFGFRSSPKVLTRGMQSPELMRSTSTFSVVAVERI
jgi:hypothetical protein